MVLVSAFLPGLAQATRNFKSYTSYVVKYMPPDPATSPATDPSFAPTSTPGLTTATAHPPFPAPAPTPTLLDTAVIA